MKALIRADGNARIGTGHIIRCLSLADGLTELGAEISLACNQETIESIPALEHSGYELFTLTARVEDEAGLMSARWPQGCDLLIVDHYERGVDFQRACRPWAKKIMVIEDMATREHDCEVLLDQTLGRTAEEYRGLVPDDCRLLLGPEFALLRPQFSEFREGALRRRQRDVPGEKSAGRIMVTMGAGDTMNVTELVLDGLLEADLGLEVDVLLAAPAVHSKSVNEKAALLEPSASVRVDVTDMAQSMSECDLAIGAAGTTSWERCCLGLPSIIIVMADNQEKIATELQSSGAARIIGDKHDVTSKDVANALKDMWASKGALKEMSERASHICDGQGVRRVGDILLPSSQ